MILLEASIENGLIPSIQHWEVEKSCGRLQHGAVGWHITCCQGGRPPGGWSVLSSVHSFSFTAQSDLKIHDIFTSPQPIHKQTGCVFPPEQGNPWTSVCEESWETEKKTWLFILVSMLLKTMMSDVLVKRKSGFYELKCREFVYTPVRVLLHVTLRVLSGIYISYIYFVLFILSEPCWASSLFISKNKNGNI